jgi:L-arabinose isomerase
MKIESFETSKSKVFGDLLSRKRKDKELKIGLLPGAYFEYFRMWDKTFEEQIRTDMELVVNNLRKKFKNLVSPPALCDTIDKCEEAGKLFKKEDVDVIVLCEFTYLPDYMPLQALGQVKDIPLIVYVSQTEPVIKPDIKYPQTIRDGSLIGLAQITGTFRKMDWFKNYRVVVGWLNDQAVYDKIEKYAKVANVYNNLQNKIIGATGHVFRGMFDFEYDKTKIKGKLGPEIVNIQLDHFVDMWDKVDEVTVKALFDEVKRRFRIRDIDDSDIYKSAKLAIAMKNIVERFSLDALVYRGQHYTEKKFQTTAYLGSAMLQENGIMVASEGDVHGLVMMMIQKLLTGYTPFFVEWSSFDEELNALLLMGHGFADPTIAKDPKEVWITSSPENWGYTGKGFSFEFTGKPGSVTLGHFIDDQKGYRMLISGGEILDLPPLSVEEVNLRVKVEKPVKEYIAELLYHGFAHHCMVVYGDVREELSFIADLMGINKVFI